MKEQMSKKRGSVRIVLVAWIRFEWFCKHNSHVITQVHFWQYYTWGSKVPLRKRCLELHWVNHAIIVQVSVRYFCPVTHAPHSWQYNNTNNRDFVKKRGLQYSYNTRCEATKRECEISTLIVLISWSKMKIPFGWRLTLETPHEGQDNFFLWSMVILPIVAESAYMFDAWYYVAHFSLKHNYQGLLSTIFVVFSYLRYCVPIESRKGLIVFFIITCILNEIGTIGYLVVYIAHKQVFNIIIYFGWAALELVMTGVLIYYRVYEQCLPTFHLESKHLFHFISRLEVILAIFIPFFMNNMSITLTKHSIGFFLLFEFFAESYSRFQGFWIKSTLYLFVCTVTVCVACEWVYSSETKHVVEIVASTFELMSGCLCNVMITLQFIPYHFRPAGIAKIARQAVLLHKTLAEAEAMEKVVNELLPVEEPTTVRVNEALSSENGTLTEIVVKPSSEGESSKDTVIDVEYWEMLFFCWEQKTH